MFSNLNDIFYSLPAYERPPTMPHRYITNSAGRGTKVASIAEFKPAPRLPIAFRAHCLTAKLRAVQQNNHTVSKRRSNSRDGV